jgi:chemotaxis signal transduction protein
MTGGVVFRVADALFFLPATVANKVLPMPIVTRVPGAPHDLVGVALVEGETVPVVAVGLLERRASRRANNDRPRADNRPMLLCDYLGERVGLVGLEIIATGRFEAAGSPSDQVVHAGVRVSPFDVAAVVDRLREGRWAV